MTLRIGVIGTGYLGSRHAEKLSRLEGATLVGVYDLCPERAANVAVQTGCRSFPSLEALLGGVDAAVVAVPSGAHAEVTSSVLGAGRSALVEKPLAATLPEATALVALAREKAVVLQVGHVERFNPAFEAACALVSAPRYIECHRMSPFSPRGLDLDVVLELMIHDIELLLWLVREPVVDVEAEGASVLTSRLDHATARLRFAGGCVAELTASRVAEQRQRRLRVFQDGESICVDLDRREVDRTVRWMSASGPETRTLAIPVSSDDALTRELQAFVQAVSLNHPPRVSGEQGLAALEVAYRILSSVQSVTVAA